ncbi:MAG: hypothetical protein DMG39_29220 [Acidobacteria bacterium]|nr:MAG: hypothetical protein DMG39_29220 [Acidobacteriota bacterium]
MAHTIAGSAGAGRVLHGDRAGFGDRHAAAQAESGFIYYCDRFTRPQPFRADIVVSIDDVFEKKVNMLDAHASQFYEWLPWTEGQFEQVPKDPAERRKWLAAGPLASRKLQPEWRKALQKRYGAQAGRIQHAEAFEITEYGQQPSEEEIRRLFPFFPDR